MSSLSIGTSALQAFQRALSTTSHNISNVGTEGYSRQRLELSAMTPQFSGGSYFGSGVQVSGITRIADQFIETQLRSATSNSSQQSVYYDFARRVDNLLADTDAGLSSGLQRFFSAVQDVSNDPTSNAARQVLLSEAESLVNQFAAIDQRLTEQRGVVNGQIETTVLEINSMAEALARLNTDIVIATGRGGGQAPSDLLDQRDTLLRQLAERVTVTTTEQENGALNIFIGNGQNLVLGERASTLTAEALGADAEQLNIGFSAPGMTAATDVTRFMTGGSLGALLDVRASVLDVAQNALGRTAIGLADAFNSQHRLGQDLNGRLGQDFFTVPTAQVLAARGNEGTNLPGVEIVDVGALTTSDYRLRYVDDQWELRREPGGQVVGVGVDDDGDPTAIFTAEGLRIDTLNLNTDNSFLIRPTRNAVQELGTLIRDPREVAAAALDVQATAGVRNEGDATLTVISATGPAGIVWPESVEWDVTQNADGLYLGGRGPISTPVDLFILENDGRRLQVRITGQLVEGDTFTVTSDPLTVGDNRNALALAGLQNDRFLAGGTSTIEGTYNTLVAEVGTRTRQAEIAAQSQGRLLEQVQAQRESLSGVNLDEEAANLLRFQQAYQAAAQVVSITNSLFDTLIGVMRR